MEYNVTLLVEKPNSCTKCEFVSPRKYHTSLDIPGRAIIVLKNRPSGYKRVNKHNHVFQFKNKGILVEYNFVHFMINKEGTKLVTVKGIDPLNRSTGTHAHISAKVRKDKCTLYYPMYMIRTNLNARARGQKLEKCKG